MVERITHAISLGATYELAAGYAGISYELFRQWREKHVAFLAAVKEAEGKAAIGWLEQIEAAANDGTWQAAAWKLERRYPHEYGRTAVDQRHSGAAGSPVTIRIETVDDRPRPIEPGGLLDDPGAAGASNGRGTPQDRRSWP